MGSQRRPGRRGRCFAALAGWAAWAALTSGAAALERDLPPAPITRALPRAPAPEGLVGVKLFRVDAEHAAMRVETRTPVPASRIRVLVDRDPAERGDRESGADLMIEGGIGFYAGYSRGVRWVELGAMPWIAAEGSESRVHWLLLPAPPEGVRAISWAVEGVAPGDAVHFREPARGLSRAEFGQLPLLEPPAAEAPAPWPDSIATDAPLSPRFAAMLDAYPWEPIPLDSADPATLFPPFLSGPARLEFLLKDARTGEESACVPLHAWRDGDLRFRWSGETLGLAWEIIFEHARSQEILVRAGVTSPDPAERAIEWTVRARLPSPAEAGEPDAAMTPLPFRMAVLPGGAVTLMGDPLEPRDAVFTRDPGGTAMDLRHRMMLTPRTLRFPSQGTLSCSLRAFAVDPGVPAFRAVVAAMHERGDLSAGAHPPHSTTGAPPVAVRLSPWAVDLPWPGAWPRTETSARALLLWHAATRGDAEIPGARSALLAAMRNSGGGWALEIGDALTPYGLRIPVSVNPALVSTAAAPWNPGRRIIQWLDETMGDSSKVWMEWEGEHAGGDGDFNAAALACARYPAGYLDPLGPPRIAPARASAELLRDLADRPAARRPLIAVRDGSATGYALAPWTDLFVETTRAWMERPAAERAERLFLLRALAGHRRVRFMSEAADSVSRVFANELLSWGMELTGGDTPAAVRAIATRLASAGWQPWSAARTAGAEARVETFGAAGLPVRHVTVVSRAAHPIRAEIRIPSEGQRVAVTLPLTGEARVAPVRDGHATVLVPLAPGGVAVLDWFAPEQADAERAFLGALGTDAARVALTNLDSALRAESAGWTLDTDLAAVALEGAQNPLQVRVRASGAEPGVVERVRLRAGGADIPLMQEPRLLAAGEELTLTAPLTVPGPAQVWAEVQKGGQRHTLTQVRLPAWTPMIELRPETDTAVCAGAVLPMTARVRNHSAVPRRVTVSCDGAEAPAETLELQPGEERVVEREVSGRPGSEREFTWRLEAEGGWRASAAVRVTFLDEVRGALRDRRARVEASSSAPGAGASAAVDGNAQTAWASDRADAEPSMVFRPAAPVRASRLVLRWPYVQGIAQSPAQLAVERTDTDARVHAVDVIVKPSGETEIEFPAASVASVRVRLPRGRGSPAAPDRLWIAEAELQ
ncbi:MAG: hypothetical protein KBA51_01340 [Kiritimatiellae bacterium]|nr:hypothetical protein [Kiritimatiellia bacterium]